MWIAHRVRVRDPLCRSAQQNALDRQFQLLTAQRPGHFRDDKDVVRNVARRERRANSVVDLPFERVIQYTAGGQDDEEWHVRGPPQVLQIHYEAVENFGYVFDDTVYLARPHANAHPVDRGVRAPVDNHTARWCDFDPVAV